MGLDNAEGSDGKYRPPKMRPMAMDGEGEDDDEGGARGGGRAARREKEMRRRAGRSQLVRELAAEVRYAPRRSDTYTADTLCKIPSTGDANEQRGYV